MIGTIYVELDFDKDLHKTLSALWLRENDYPEEFWTLISDRTTTCVPADSRDKLCQYSWCLFLGYTSHPRTTRMIKFQDLQGEPSIYCGHMNIFHYLPYSLITGKMLDNKEMVKVHKFFVRTKGEWKWSALDA